MGRVIAPVRRSLKVDGREVALTPLLVPAFSSEVGFGMTLGPTLDRTLGRLLGPLLVSAYDLAGDGDQRIGARLTRATVPFAILDSGGYELNKHRESEGPTRVDWCRSTHAELAERWRPGFPVIVVSYDDPREGQVGVPAQLERARQLFSRLPGAGRCMLIKSPHAGAHLTVDDVRSGAADLAGFDVVGVAEKDIGASIGDRLRFVRDLRLLLDRHGLDLPIHVFGGLDPFLAPLYMFAGADVFDGLGWLRHGYLDGLSATMQGTVARTRPDGDFVAAEWAVRRANLGYLADLQVAMHRIALGGSVEELGPLAARILEVHGMTFRETT